MCRALVGGILQAGFPGERIRVSDPFPEALETVRQRFPAVCTTSSNRECWQSAEVVILAVKPNVVRVCSHGSSSLAAFLQFPDGGRVLLCPCIPRVCVCV